MPRIRRRRRLNEDEIRDVDRRGGGQRRPRLREKGENGGAARRAATRSLDSLPFGGMESIVRSSILKFKTGQLWIEFERMVSVTTEPSKTRSRRTPFNGWHCRWNRLCGNTKDRLFVVFQL